MSPQQILKSALVIAFAFLVYSCGRKKETVETKRDGIVEITPLKPSDTAGANRGDWVIKQEMSDAEKLNPTVTNDATASGITLYIFENLLDVDRVTYELVPLLAKSLPVTFHIHLTSGKM